MKCGSVAALACALQLVFPELCEGSNIDKEFEYNRTWQERTNLPPVSEQFEFGSQC